jgi:hypothetical protein
MKYIFEILSNCIITCMNSILCNIKPNHNHYLDDTDSNDNNEFDYLV